MCLLLCMLPFAGTAVCGTIDRCDKCAAQDERVLRHLLFCGIIFRVSTNVFTGQTQGCTMEEKTNYYVLKEKAVPDVLLRVVEAKRLLESGRAASVQEATGRVDISRSSFYKYKEDIFPFHDNAKGRTITLVIQLDDEPGLLSAILKTIADSNANILTIHQSIPVGGVASLTLSIEILPDTEDANRMMERIEQQEGVHYLKILARE